MKVHFFIFAIFVLISLISCNNNVPPPITTFNVTPNEFVGKSYVGYQAWFNTPNDGTGRGWFHWGSTNPLQPSQMVFEMMPYTAEYPADSLQDSGFTLGNGSPAKFFSGYNQGVINTHFRWMSEYKIDGAFLNWFIVDGYDYRLAIAKRVKAAAEAYGREFSIMFDFSGTKASHLSPACNTGPQLVECIKTAWIGAVNAGIVSSSQYMRVNGLPLLSIWGFGYDHNDNMTAQDTINLLDWFHNSAPAQYRATIMGGVASYWRTKGGPDAGQWQSAFAQFDILSPWAVAQTQDQNSITNYMRDTVTPDLQMVSQRNQKYLPVIFPGFSWYNLFKDKPKNQIPRQGGQFIWSQARALNQLGIQSFYTAMFDEVDEGTAIMKTAGSASEAPQEFYTLTLDADGRSYPNDWYLQVSRAISDGLKTNNGFQNTNLPISP